VIEAFNCRFRDECLNLHWFATVKEARQTIEAWRIEYNTERPHRGLSQQTPAAWDAAWAPNKACVID
jgi:putative transposase